VVQSADTRLCDNAMTITNLMATLAKVDHRGSDSSNRWERSVW
jgi:hypothetical protein